MKKINMKKSKLLLLVLTLLAMLGVSIAGNVSTTNLSSQYTQCTNESIDEYYYIVGQNYTRNNTRDSFGNSQSTSVISAGDSNVQIWRNNGVISNCSNWGRISNIVKKSNYDQVLALLNFDGCTFNKPSYQKVNRPTDIDAQIHFVIGYYETKSRGTPKLNTHWGYKDFEDAYWTCYAGGTGQDISDCDETTVHRKSTLKQHVGECINYRVFWCGDGLVNGRDKNGSVITSYTNGNYSEQCDPNDPNHTNWGTNGCTLTCQQDNTQPTPYCGNGILEGEEQCDPGSNNFGNGCDGTCHLMTPSCTLTVNPNQGNAPLSTTINGTKPSWATYFSLNFGDGSPVQNNPVFSLNHTYSSVGTFNLTLTVQNNYNGQINGTRPTATCSASVHTTTPPPTQECGNGILEGDEQCDPGSSNFGNGCDGTCHLMTPSCTLTVNPNQGNAPLSPIINGTKPNWATYTNLVFGDGQSQSNPVFALNHTYTTVGTFNLTLTVLNNYNGQINGTRPTATCSASVHTTTPPPEPQGLLTIQKELLTTGSFPAGSLVGYKITLKNIGSGVFHNAYIEDTMPRSLEYISSNIQGIGNGYQFSQWDDTLGQHHVKYYNFDLNPNQSAILYLTGRLRDGYSFNETTNCVTTNSGLQSCVYFTPQPIPYVKKWQKVGNMDFTDQQISVNIGDYIVYKVDFANIGGATAVGIVKDYLPNCVTYVDSSIHGVNGATFMANANNTVIGYRDFSLAAGQTGYMLVTGQINGNGSCQNVYSYLNTGSFKFTNGNEIYSSVIAVRPQGSQSVVVFDKTGNKSVMYPGETGLEFYITVTNQGPNTISNIYVDDIRPDNETCIIYDDWAGENLEEVSHLRRHYLGRNGGGNGGRGSNEGGGKINNNNGGGNGGTNVDPMGKLYAGESFSFTIYAHIANNPSCVGSYVNTGKLTYTEGGTTHTLYDNYPFQVITVPGINVSITKTVDQTHVQHGQTITYTITYKNNGTTALTNYVIRDYWPAMIQYVSSNPTTNDIVTTNQGSTITWHFSQPLAAGETRTITAVGIVR